MEQEHCLFAVTRHDFPQFAHKLSGVVTPHKVFIGCDQQVRKKPLFKRHVVRGYQVQPVVEVSLVDVSELLDLKKLPVLVLLSRYLCVPRLDIFKQMSH